MFTLDKPQTDKIGHINHLKMAANAIEHGDSREAGLILTDIIDTLSADRVAFSYNGAKSSESKSKFRKSRKAGGKSADFTRPIYQLSSGRKGYTILSHSVGPDWCSPENYIDEVREDYAPLFAAAPGMLASLDSINKEIYAAGAPLGSNRYFAIRKLACDAVNPLEAFVAR